MPVGRNFVPAVISTISLEPGLGDVGHPDHGLRLSAFLEPDPWGGQIPAPAISASPQARTAAAVQFNASGFDLHLLHVGRTPPHLAAAAAQLLVKRLKLAAHPRRCSAKAHQVHQGLITSEVIGSALAAAADNFDPLRLAVFPPHFTAQVLPTHQGSLTDAVIRAAPTALVPAAVNSCFNPLADQRQDEHKGWPEGPKPGPNLQAICSSLAITSSSREVKGTSALQIGSSSLASTPSSRGSGAP